MGTVGAPAIGRTPGDPWVTAVNRGLLLRSGTERTDAAWGGNESVLRLRIYRGKPTELFCETGRVIGYIVRYMRR